MRPLKSHFPDQALTTLDTLLKQTKEARVFRRAQAVREVVAGYHIDAVSAAFHLAAGRSGSAAPARVADPAVAHDDPVRRGADRGRGDCHGLRRHGRR